MYFFRDFFAHFHVLRFSSGGIRATEVELFVHRARCPCHFCRILELTSDRRVLWSNLYHQSTLHSAPISANSVERADMTDLSPRSLYPCQRRDFSVIKPGRDNTLYLHIFSTTQHQTMLRILPNQTMLRILPNQTMLRILSNQTILRIPPNQTLLRISIPNQTILRILPNQTMLRILTNQTTLKIHPIQIKSYYIFIK